MKKLKPDQARELRKIIVNALDDLKGQNILALDVSEHSSITDTMIIATGNSNRQVRALVDHAIEEAKAQGFRHSSVDENRKNDWVIADFGSVVLHVLIPEAREYYDLERLWQVEGNVIVDTDDVVAKPKKKTTRAKVAEVEIIFDKDSLETQTDRARATKAAPRRKALESVDAQLKKAPLKAGALAKTGIKRSDAIKASKEAKALAKPAAKKAAAKTTAAKAGAAKPAAKAAAAKTAAKPATKTATKTAAKSAAKPAAKTGAKAYAEKPSASAAKSAGARAARTATKAKD